MRHVVLWVILLAACSEGGGAMSDSGTDAASADGLVSRVIGVEGGSLTSSDGRLTLMIPPGAVDADTTFTIASAPTARSEARLGPAWTIGPADVQLFARATVSIRYLPEEVTAADEATLRVLVLDEVAGRWNFAAPSSLDVSSDTLSTMRSHFSTLSFTDVARGLVETGADALETAGTTLYVDVTGDDTLGTGSSTSPLRSLVEACGRTIGGSTWRSRSTTAIDYGSVTEIQLGAGTFAAGRALCGPAVHGEHEASTVLEGTELVDLFAGGSDFTLEGGARIFVTNGRLERVTVAGATGSYAVAARGLPFCVVSDVAVECAARTTTGVAAQFGVQVDDLTVRNCGIGIVLAGAAVGSTASLTRGELVGNDIGIEGGEHGHAHLVTATTVRDNRIGVRAHASLGLAGGGNVFACNTEVDVDALDGVTVDASGNAWDHVPPAIAGGSDPLLNDVRGSVTTTGATLAPDPCVTPMARGVRVILRTGDPIPSTADPVLSIDFSSVARGPTGTVCAVVTTAGNRQHLVCDTGAGSGPSTLLSDGDTIPSTATVVTELQGGAAPVVGDGVVAFGGAGGGIVVMDTNGAAGRHIAGTTSEIHMTDDGSLVVWADTDSVWAHRGGTPVRVFGPGVNTADMSESGLIASEPAIDASGAIWMRGAATTTGGAIVVDRGGGAVLTPLRVGAAIGGGLTIREIVSHGVGPTGHVYAHVYTTPPGPAQLVHMAPDGTLLRVPETTLVGARAITWFTRIQVAADGSAVVMGSLSGTDGLFLVQPSGDVEILFAAGDPIPGGGAATFDNYVFGQYDYLPDGTFMLRAKAGSGTSWYILRGPIAGSILPVVESGVPLESGGPIVHEIQTRLPTHLGGARALAADGHIAFTVLFPSLVDYALVTTVP